MYAKNQGPISKDEKVLNFLSPIRDRQADIVAYRVNVCYQKGSSRVNWIIGKEDCMQKNQGPNSRDKKFISFKLFLDRRTDVLACGGALCRDVLWLIGMQKLTKEKRNL